MKLILFLALLGIAVGLQVVPLDTDAKCHPQCRWACDDPVCPAQCHPVCARPKCEMQCSEMPCAKCMVKCEEPKCSIRCPKDMCQKENCPKCEIVCEPADCHTTCLAPTAECSPMCEEPECNWSCAKPTVCPRPKCELVCEKPACDYADELAKKDEEAKKQAESLGTQAGVIELLKKLLTSQQQTQSTQPQPTVLLELSAGAPLDPCPPEAPCPEDRMLRMMEMADKNTPSIRAEMRPSLIEVMDTQRHKFKSGWSPKNPFCLCPGASIDHKPIGSLASNTKVADIKTPSLGASYGMTPPKKEDDNDPDAEDGDAQ